MAQERKLVTVLFADIVGSTRTVGTVDAEIVRETLDRAFESLERVLADQGHGREAREHVEWLLHYYRDPVARPRYDEAQALLAECEALTG